MHAEVEFALRPEVVECESALGIGPRRVPISNVSSENIRADDRPPLRVFHDPFNNCFAFQADRLQRLLSAGEHRKAIDPGQPPARRHDRGLNASHRNRPRAEAAVGVGLHWPRRTTLYATGTIAVNREIRIWPSVDVQHLPGENTAAIQLNLAEIALDARKDGIGFRIDRLGRESIGEDFDGETMPVDGRQRAEAEASSRVAMSLGKRSWPSQQALDSRRFVGPGKHSHPRSVHRHLIGTDDRARQPTCGRRFATCYRISGQRGEGQRRKNANYAAEVHARAPGRSRHKPSSVLPPLHSSKLTRSVSATPISAIRGANHIRRGS